MSDAHCEACGTRREAAVRCETCGALSGSAWILALGGALWLAVFATYGVMTHWVWPDLLKVLSSLGADPPISARAYVLVNRWVPLVPFALALLGPVVVLTLGRGRPGRFRRGTRLYAATAVVGLGWVLAGLGFYWASVTRIRDALA